MIRILFTDASLTPIGQPIAQYLQFQATPMFNQPGPIQVTLAARPQYIELAQPGNGLMILEDDQVLAAGPIEYPGQLSWSADGSAGDAEPGLLTVGAVDDSVWLGCRLTYPDPAHAATAQTTDFYTATGVNAETGMRDLVNLNAGPGALTARQVPELVLGRVAGVGSNINIRTRFDVLSDVLRAAALAGGNLGYTVVRDGGALNFSVYAPTDLSGSVRFSRGLRNLRAVAYQPQAPTATVAIVGGDGTGTSRTIAERSNTAALAAGWGRIEAFVSGSGTDSTDLNQAGDAALISAAEQGQLVVSAIDTPKQRYGTAYNLGDRVAVELVAGLTITDIVRAVTIIGDKTGVTRFPQIGSASASADPAYVRKLRDQDRRLGQLESRT